MCPDPYSDEYFHEIVRSMYFWIGGIATFVIGSLGIIGNIISIHIGRRMKLKSAFINLLIVLAYFDTCYLLICIVHQSILLYDKQQPNYMTGSNFHHSPVYSILYPYVLHPLRHVFQTASIITTVIISLVRYVAVLHPFFYSRKEEK